MSKDSSETRPGSRWVGRVGELVAGLLGILVGGPALSFLSTFALTMLLLAACTATIICGLPVAQTLDRLDQNQTETPDIELTLLAPTTVAAQPLPDNVLRVHEAEGRSYLRLSPDGRILVIWEQGEVPGLVWIDFAAGETHVVLPDELIGDAAWLTNDQALVSRVDFNRHWVVNAAQPQPFETYFVTDVGAEEIQRWLGQGGPVFSYGAYTIVIGPDVLIKDLSRDDYPSVAQDVRIIQLPFASLGQKIPAWEPEQRYAAPDGQHTAILENGSGSLIIFDPSGRARAQTAAGDYYPSPRTECTILPLGWRYDSAGVLYRVSCEVYNRPLWSPVLMLPNSDSQ